MRHIQWLVHFKNILKYRYRVVQKSMTNQSNLFTDFFFFSFQFQTKNKLFPFEFFLGIHENSKYIVVYFKDSEINTFSIALIL